MSLLSIQNNYNPPANWANPENIHTIARMAFGILRVRGEGVLWTGIPKAQGDTYFKSGISTGDRQEYIPWKHLFFGLSSLNKAQTDNNAYDRRSRIQDKHPLISDVFAFICRRNQQAWVAYQAPEAFQPLNIIFFPRENRAHKIFCLFNMKSGLLTKHTTLTFSSIGNNYWPQRLKLLKLIRQVQEQHVWRNNSEDFTVMKVSGTVLLLWS